MQQIEVTSARLCYELGITRRQAQWWDEKRLVKPRVVRHRRSYDMEDALMAAAVAGLRSKRMSLLKIRRLLPKLFPKPLETVEHVREGGSVYLFVSIDGLRFHLCETPTAYVLGVVAQWRKPLVIIRLGEELRRAWTQRKAAPESVEFRGVWRR